MATTSVERAYWLDGTAYCAECVECDAPAIDADEAEIGEGCGKCGCCGRQFDEDERGDHANQ